MRHSSAIGKSREAPEGTILQEPLCGWSDHCGRKPHSPPLLPGAHSMPHKLQLFAGVDVLPVPVVLLQQPAWCLLGLTSLNLCVLRVATVDIVLS